ncbi:MAG TPA: gamma-glutamyltransferase [Chloroflexota bacterium]|jgi:gamma-glutamyltranspeptidase / glutathione hydrolase|nr:gamma-glutamyltransferase [Chloroflexota bacterium]
MGNGPSELREWAVSSSHAVATEAGAAVLRAGGNAVDAAAAVQSTLGVVEPLASGLGGGAFWLIFAANEMRTYALDARETAPAAATPDIFLGRDGEPLDENERAASGLAVAVPGALLGLEEVLRQFGTISLAEALEPAIRAANNGVPVSAFMTSRIGLGSANNRARLRRSPAASAVFLPGGTPLGEGNLLVQRELGQTLTTLAERGSGELYRGAIGKAIVDEVRARGGRMTLDDLSAYRTVWRDPLSRPYGAHEILTFGPPGSGVSLLAMLSMLDTLRAERPWRSENDAAHILVEVMRCTFADRCETLGDPGHVQVPVTGLLDPSYIAQRCFLVDPARAQQRWSAGDPWPFEPTYHSPYGPQSAASSTAGPGQTTHFTTADRWGNVVAATATIESLFGSGIMVPGVGLLLNNQMSDFNERPRGPNQVRPGARPLSSMAPTMVMCAGRPVLTLGSPGGTTIVPTIVQVLTRVLDAEQPLDEAIAAPRLYAGPERRVTWEEGTDPRLLEYLSERGHEIAAEARTIGNVQSIQLDWATGNLTAVADPRRQGSTAQEGEA